MVEVHPTGMLRQVLRCIHRGVRPDDDGLTGHCGPPGGDAALALAVVRTADLAPFAGPVHVRLACLERRQHRERANGAMVFHQLKRVPAYAPIGLAPYQV